MGLSASKGNTILRNIRIEADYSNKQISSYYSQISRNIH